MAGFSRQFASGGKATARDLGTLTVAWETLAHLPTEIRKCPKVHELAECSGVAAARGGEATPGSHSWHLSSHVPAACADSAALLQEPGGAS